MPYTYLFLFLLFFPQLVFSQENTTVIATYNFDDSFYYHDEGPIKGVLVNSGGKSLYSNNLKEIAPGTKYINDNNRTTGELVDDKDQYFKNFDSNFLLSHSNISYQEKVILKDSLKMFSWKITNKNKEILGYQCIGAKTTFRGRNYTAYYTPDIPISDGPWKFNGLPGLILEVAEENNRIHYEAVELKIIKDKTEISPPFEIEKAKSWDEILSNAKKRYRAKKAEVEQKYGGRVTTKFNGIEVYDLNE